MHLKRNKMPKTWPIERKGTTYIVRPVRCENGIPLLLALRNMLELAKTKKDVKNILNAGKVKINSKIVKDERYSLTLFDILTLENKSFRLILKNKKFNFEDAKSDEKIAKVVGKKMLKNSKLQINLSDGRNYLIKDKVNTGDSVVVDLKDSKIKEILAFKENAKVLFISGKHLGEHGKVEKIEGNTVKIKVEKEEISAHKENLMIVK